MGQYDRQRRKYPKAAGRAQRQARRETAPQRRQTARDIGRAQRQGERASRSARRTYGRQAASERALAQNLPGGIATPGLVKKQLLAGAQQTARYGQGLSQLAARASRQDVRSMQEDQEGLVRQTAAAKLAEIVASRREAEAERKAATKAGRSEARFQISRIAKDKAGGGIGQIHQQQVRDWLAKTVASTEGVDLTPQEARKMVERLYRKLAPTLPKPAESAFDRLVRPGAPLLSADDLKRYQRYGR